VASVGYAAGGTALRLTMVREDGEARAVYEDVDPAYASPWLAVVASPDGRQLVFGAPGRLVRLACADGH
jgi:S-adenosylhomocysteine hydrolase